MNNKERIYGPPLIIEKSGEFYIRKFKRELAYFFLVFTIPLYSFEFLREFYLNGSVNTINVIKAGTRSLLIMGPAYAIISAYMMYVPKEKYWVRLEKKANENYSYENNLLSTKEKLIKERDISLRDQNSEN